MTYVWIIMQAFSYEGEGFVEAVEDDETLALGRLVKHIKESGNARFKGFESIHKTGEGQYRFDGGLESFFLDRRPVTSGKGL